MITHKAHIFVPEAFRMAIRNLEQPVASDGEAPDSGQLQEEGHGTTNIL